VADESNRVWLRREREGHLDVENWRAVPRSEMFGRVIGTLNATAAKAFIEGDDHFPPYWWRVLRPFLDAEQETAIGEEKST
jgi:hypothetical protein